jgi:drug/metabolite transporter (DMT)-like permease
MSTTGAAGRLRLILAFVGVYLIWSSTYLGIRFCIREMPPFLFAGARIVLAGVLVLLAARASGIPWPDRARARPAAVMGTFLFLGGNGGVVWALQTLPSGVAALIVGTTPLWMALLQRVRHPAERLGAPAKAGLVLGFFGVAVLADPFAAGPGDLDPAAVGMVVLSALAWSWGSVWGREQRLPDSTWMSAGVQMAAGGAALLLVSVLRGEGGFAPGVSAATWGTFAYLVLFGTIAGFTSFYYLLRHQPPHVASSYAYVNPVVAVLLGWWILGESLTWKVLLAGALIVPGVLLMTLSPGGSPSGGGARKALPRRALRRREAV